MEKKVGEGVVAYQNDEGTVYAVTPISDIAGFLAATALPLEDPKADLDFIFADTGLTKLVIFIEEHNVPFIKLARRLGFKQEGRLKKACSTGDFLVFGQYR